MSEAEGALQLLNGRRWSLQVFFRLVSDVNDADLCTTDESWNSKGIAVSHNRLKAQSLPDKHTTKGE